MSLETGIFNLLLDRKHHEALMLATSSKALNINALDEEGLSFFFMAVIAYKAEEEQERLKFIEFLLVHPDFKQANTPMEGDSLTPFEMAIEQNDPKAIDLIIKHKDSKDVQVVFNAEDKLLYELQAQKIKRSQKRQEEQPSDSNAVPLDQQKQILESLLSTAVLHAIKTDDPSILQRLADVGAKLYYPLKDGTYPMDLVRNNPELKVHQWLAKAIKDYMSSSPTMTLAAHGLARKHAEKEQAIVGAQIDKTSESIRTMFKFFDYQEPVPEDAKKQVTSTQSKTPGNQ